MSYRCDKCGVMVSGFEPDHICQTDKLMATVKYLDLPEARKIINDLRHESANWKERALNAERRLQVYSTRVQGKEPTEDELEAFRNHSSTQSSGGAEP